MIVTLDTSILVRATDQSSGPARRVVEMLVQNPEHTIALSHYILGEVGKVLSYSRLYQLLKLSPDDIRNHLDFLNSVVELVDPLPGLPVVLNDPKDDPVLYTAIAAGADVLCSRDQDFFAPGVIAVAAKHGLAIMDDVRLLSALQLRFLPL